MKYATRRTKGVRWDCWHRMVVMRSLELMVMNGVVRRATVDPPQHLDDCADIDRGTAAAFASMPPGLVDNQGWFTRFFRRRIESPFTHARHTT
jgi:hypothetical protein